MIIQLPCDTTSIVLRFDGPDAADFGLGQTITLLSGSEPTPAAVTNSRGPARLPALGVRRRTMLACGVAGMLVAGFGVSILQSPHAEPTLYQPRPTVWNDSPSGMPTRMPDPIQAELARGPTVIPPETGRMPAPSRPAGAQPGNPFGLE